MASVVISTAQSDVTLVVAAIHRDLKPANILVGAFGEVQVMDWGLMPQWMTPLQTGSCGPRSRVD